ncbi:MAG: BACON domain-containing protein [Bacteroidales bacterium]|nr:BACON domain-containing protein [Bacteroidales bacterium]
MKKIYSIILTTVVCLAGFAACTHDYPVGPMARNISLNPDAVQAPADGQTYDVAVTADGAWVADTPDWITVKPASGEGGQTVKVIVAPNNDAERTDKVKFYSAVGDVIITDITLESTPLAELAVIQAAGESQGGGGEEQTISIADYLALGPNTDTYIITGAITRVVNTSYGNFDLTDETGTIYVWGLLNEDLEAQKCWKDKGLAMGDVLTVKVNEMKLYNGEPEIVNAVYISHTKSLFDLEEDSVTVGKEGGAFDINAVVKGNDVKADYEADWITFKGAEKDGENVTLHFEAAGNPGSPRNTVITLSTTTDKGETSTVEFTVNQDGSIIDATVAEILAAEDDPLVLYRVTGFISKVTNLSKGRIYITDYTGTVYAFGTRVNEASDASIDLATLGLAEGDIVTIVGYKTTYVSGSNSTIEIVGYVDGFTKVESVTVEQFLAKEVSAEKWYRLTGIVTKPNAEETAAGNKFDLNQYGNFRLVDETGRVYVFGVLTGYGQPNNKLFSSLGVAEGNEITIVGNRAEFKGAPQVGKAWYVSHKEVTPPEEPEDPGNVATITDAQLPTAYPAEESTFTEGGYEYTFFKVANYGNGIQIQGKQNAYLYNKTAMPSEIKTITITGHPSKDYYPENLKIFAGSAVNPAGEALTGTLDESGKVHTFAVPAGCTYFKILNDTKYAVYLESIKVAL